MPVAGGELAAGVDGYAAAGVGRRKNVPPGAVPTEPPDPTFARRIVDQIDRSVAAGRQAASERQIWLPQDELLDRDTALLPGRPPGGRKASGRMTENRDAGRGRDAPVVDATFHIYRFSFSRHFFMDFAQIVSPSVAPPVPKTRVTRTTRNDRSNRCDSALTAAPIVFSTGQRKSFR